MFLSRWASPLSFKEIPFKITHLDANSFVGTLISNLLEWVPLVLYGIFLSRIHHIELQFCKRRVDRPSGRNQENHEAI